VEIDRPDGAQRLGRYRCPPTMVISSGGSPGHAHAYWQLYEPISLDELESANRRLAIRLGGDLACVDAARILRPPTTRNWKRTPPCRVELLVFEPSRKYTLDELTAGLGEPHFKRGSSSAATRVAISELDRRLLAIPAATYMPALTGRHPNRAGKIACPFHALSAGRSDATGDLPARSLADASATEDPLRLVPPRVYFERLTGLRVGQSGKLHCLFHDDRSPSLHVYPEPDRGWYCFGCGRGGSVFDLAALLWGRGTRGSDFLELRRQLEEVLLPSTLVSHSERSWTP
ncbi:MAG: CHC2 zinc finger domain-containing protein, partial [Solirubrobacteraceae bacterium]